MNTPIRRKVESRHHRFNFETVPRQARLREAHARWQGPVHDAQLNTCKKRTSELVCCSLPPLSKIAESFELRPLSPKPFWLGKPSWIPTSPSQYFLSLNPEVWQSRTLFLQVSSRRRVHCFDIRLCHQEEEVGLFSRLQLNRRTNPKHSSSS